MSNKIKFLILFCLASFALNAQSYQRDGKGIKFIQLEGCLKTSNGQPCDSCFVITNGLNGKLNRCIHISQLRQLINGGGGMDSTYLIDNENGTYTLFNENGDSFDFGYQLDVSGDTLYLLDHDGHIADYLIGADFDNQTLSWDSATLSLGISNGNTVILNGFGDDGNGIYGGSGEVPDTAYAHVSQDSSFWLGDFPSHPGTNNSDRGMIVGSSGIGLQGMHFYGGQKPGGLFGYGRISCDDILFKMQNPFGIPAADTRLTISEYNLRLYNGGYGYLYMEPDSLTTFYGTLFTSTTNYGLEINGTRGTDGQVLTSYGSYAIWADPCCDTIGGGGADSINLGLIGNELNLYVDGLTDTSLVIGELNTNLSGNVITTEVNNVTDTTLVIGNVTSSLSGTVLTTSVNGVIDTAQLSGILGSTTNVLTYSNPILTSTVNGVTDTALVSSGGVSDVSLDLSGNILTSDVDGVNDTSLVIGELATTLSGNTITTEVNGVIDTTLVIGELNTNLSGNILTTEVNNVTDTSLVIGSNVLSWNATDKILTSSVNGVSDTSFVTGLNGIYSGSGSVPDSTYSHIAKSQFYTIGYQPTFPSINNTRDRSISIHDGIHLTRGDSINEDWGILSIENNKNSFGQHTAAINSHYIMSVDSNVMALRYAANNEGHKVRMTMDSFELISFNEMMIDVDDSLHIEIAGNKGSNGQVLTSNGSTATWQTVSGGATTNTLSLSGNTMTSNVDGVIDTSLVIGEIMLDNQSNIMTVEVNNQTDTTLIIHNLSNGVVGNTLTTTVNGVPASTTVILKDSLELSGNIMQLMVNGIYDTSLVIGNHTISWDSTNKILTSAVNGVSDTTKITVATGGATTNTLSLSGNVLTSTVDAIADTSLVIGGHTVSYDRSTSILTSTVNGVSDTAQLAVTSIISPSQITSDQDDYNPTGFDNASIVRISGDNGIRAITSMVSQSDGEQKTFINVGDYPIYFPGEHPDGTAANRINANTDIILYPKSSIIFIYDGTTSRWQILSQNRYDENKTITYNTQFGSITAGDYGEVTQTVLNGINTVVPASSTIPFGAVRMSTNATLGFCIVGVAKGMVEPCYLTTGHIITRSLVAFSDLSTSAQRFAYIFAIKDSIDQASYLYQGILDPIGTDAMAIVYSDSLNSGNWTGVTATTGGTYSTVDLGVAVAEDVAYDLQVAVDKAKSEVRFYINGVMKGRLTTNIPATDAVGSQNWFGKHIGTTTRYCYLNQYMLKYILP